MKAKEIIALMESWAPGTYEGTCDTVKCGDPEMEVSCVAMCCFVSIFHRIKSNIFFSASDKCILTNSINCIVMEFGIVR